MRQKIFLKAVIYAIIFLFGIILLSFPYGPDRASVAVAGYGEEFPNEPLPPVEPPESESDSASVEGGKTVRIPQIVIGSKILIFAPTPTGVDEGNVFARLLPAFFLGNRSVIEIPYIRAADVFVFYKGESYKGGFVNPLLICLKGSGRMLFAPASGQPRRFGEIPIDAKGRQGFTCAPILEPGTIALVEASK